VSGSSGSTVSGVGPGAITGSQSTSYSWLILVVVVALSSLETKLRIYLGFVVLKEQRGEQKSDVILRVHN